MQTLVCVLGEEYCLKLTRTSSSPLLLSAADSAAGRLWLRQHECSNRCVQRLPTLHNQLALECTTAPCVLQSPVKLGNDDGVSVHVLKRLFMLLPVRIV